jgi:hypothetical protein
VACTRVATPNTSRATRRAELKRMAPGAVLLVLKTVAVCSRAQEMARAAGASGNARSNTQHAQRAAADYAAICTQMP